MNANTSAVAEQQLKGFIEKFEPKQQALIRSVRGALRKRFPSAYELAYDNYNFFVIGYSPTEQPSDAIVSIAAGAQTASVSALFVEQLCLKKVLLGSGKQTRFIRLESVKTLERADVESLLSAAVAQATTPLRASGFGSLIIRSVSTKQRPRRRATKA